MIISINSRQKIYHEEYCPYVNRIRRKTFITKKEAQKRGYSECSCCGGLRGEYLRMKLKPDILGKAKGGIALSWDKNYHGLCLRTDVGFWKVLRSDYDGRYKLYHLNQDYFDPIQSDKVLMKQRFHRQQDVPKTRSMKKIVHYVFEHDRAKKVMEQNYRNLPKSTKQQRKYYGQAKNRERRKQLKVVDNLFKQLEEERRLKHG